MAHSVKKVQLVEEMQKVSDVAKIKSLAIAAKLIVYRRQFDSTHEEICALESLIKCRKFGWARSVRMLQLQDKLHDAREKISKLQRALDGKKIVIAPKDVQ